MAGETPALPDDGVRDRAVRFHLRDFGRNPPAGAEGGLWSATMQDRWSNLGPQAIDDGAYHVDGSEWVLGFRGGRLVSAVQWDRDGFLPDVVTEVAGADGSPPSPAGSLAERRKRRTERIMIEQSTQVGGEALAGLHAKLDRVLRHVDRHFQHLKDRIDDMDMRLKRAIDDIARNRDLGASIKAGTDLLATEVTGVSTAIADQGKQITDLQTQIADLQAQIASGGAVSADDLNKLDEAASNLEATNTALTQSATDLGEANTKLGSAVPANTPAPAAGGPAPATGG